MWIAGFTGDFVLMTISAPVSGKLRIEGLDLLRGFALLGIAIVNALQLFRPEWLANQPIALAPGEDGQNTAFLFIESLFMSKFFTMFTLLFGLGFGLQYDKGSENFSRIYPRRLLVLAVMGILHSRYLYWADVLFMYACAGVFLFLARKWSATRKIQVGAGLLLCCLVWFYGLTAYSGLPILFYLAGFTTVALVLYFCRNLSATPYTAIWFLLLAGFLITRSLQGQMEPFNLETVNAQKAVAAELRQNAPEMTLLGNSYTLPLEDNIIADVIETGPREDFTRIEQYVFSEGTLAQTVEVRKRHFSRLLFMDLVMFHWRITALFLIAAGLMQWGILNPEHRNLRIKCAWTGLVLGLPLSVFSTFLSQGWIKSLSQYATSGVFIHEFSSILIAMGAGCLVFLWAERGLFSSIRGILTSAGRLALSNYIGQSLVMSLLACGYGLGLYGKLSMWELVGLSTAVFVTLALLSALWLKRFTMGPLEWLWRCLTYWQLFPLIRKNGPRSSSGAGA